MVALISTIGTLVTALFTAVIGGGIYLIFK